MTDRELIIWINKMQDIQGSNRISSLDKSWKIFYVYDADKEAMKGFCILFQYTRLPCKQDYEKGNVAEIEIFTFPEYRHQGVCKRLVNQAMLYADMKGIDIVADALDSGYAVLKPMGFIDALDHRIWRKSQKIKDRVGD